MACMRETRLRVKAAVAAAAAHTAAPPLAIDGCSNPPTLAAYLPPPPASLAQLFQAKKSVADLSPAELKGKKVLVR